MITRLYKFTSFPFFSGTPDTLFNMTLTGFETEQSNNMSFPFISGLPDTPFDLTLIGLGSFKQAISVS